MRPLVAFSALLLLFSHTASGAELSEDIRFEDDVISDEEFFNDPWENTNKTIFDFNFMADRAVFKPISDGYGELPDGFRSGVNNVLTNLSEPANVAHGILQLDPKMALTSFWRFTINSTVGLAGVRDVAGKQGLIYQNQGFTNTFHKWGFSPGYYVVVPLFGPSSVRGTTGLMADIITDPFTLIAGTPVAIVSYILVDCVNLPNGTLLILLRLSCRTTFSLRYNKKRGVIGGVYLTTSHLIWRLCLRLLIPK